MEHFVHIWYIYQSTFSVYASDFGPTSICTCTPVFIHNIFVILVWYNVWYEGVEGDCLMYASLLWLWEHEEMWNDCVEGWSLQSSSLSYTHAHNMHYFLCTLYIHKCTHMQVFHILICIEQTYIYPNTYTYRCISKSVHSYMRALNILLGCWYEIIYSGWYKCVAGVLYQSYCIRYTHLMGWSMHFAYYFNISFIPPSVQIRVCVIDRRISALSAIFSYGYVDWM